MTDFFTLFRPSSKIGITTQCKSYSIYKPSNSEWGLADEKTHLYRMLAFYRTIEDYRSSHLRVHYLELFSNKDKKKSLAHSLQKVTTENVQGYEKNPVVFAKFMNQCEATYFGSVEALPTMRARILYSLNPNTFKHQNRDNILGK